MVADFVFMVFLCVWICVSQPCAFFLTVFFSVCLFCSISVLFYLIYFLTNFWRTVFILMKERKQRYRFGRVGKWELSKRCWGGETIINTLYEKNLFLIKKREMIRLYITTESDSNTSPRSKTMSTTTSPEN